MTAAPISSAHAFLASSQPALSIKPADIPLSPQIKEAYEKMAELWAGFFEGRTGNKLLSAWRKQDDVMHLPGSIFLQFLQARESGRETSLSDSQVDTFKTVLIEYMSAHGHTSLCSSNPLDVALLKQACDAASLGFSHMINIVPFRTSFSMKDDIITLEINRDNLEPSIIRILPPPEVTMDRNPLPFPLSTASEPPPVLGMPGPGKIAI